ncbi:hypothetical protein LZ31DRAFT_261223 [Colletotrichum somersetense]|nr:hypothetical protein LZ31DRAFT_261223 [Colletotrichum somersetense]
MSAGTLSSKRVFRGREDVLLRPEPPPPPNGPTHDRRRPGPVASRTRHRPGVCDRTTPPPPPPPPNQWFDTQAHVGLGQLLTKYTKTHTSQPRLLSHTRREPKGVHQHTHPRKKKEKKKGGGGRKNRMGAGLVHTSFISCLVVRSLFAPNTI